MNRKEKQKIIIKICKKEICKIRIAYSKETKYILYNKFPHLKVVDDHIIREDTYLLMYLMDNYKYIYLRSITPFNNGLRLFENKIRTGYIDFMNAINTPKDCRDNIRNKLAEIDEYIHKRKYRSKYLNKRKAKVKRNNILKDLLYPRINFDLINIIGGY